MTPKDTPLDAERAFTVGLDALEFSETALFRSDGTETCVPFEVNHMAAQYIQRAGVTYRRRLVAKRNATVIVWEECEGLF